VLVFMVTVFMMAAFDVKGSKDYKRRQGS